MRRHFPIGNVADAKMRSMRKHLLTTLGVAAAIGIAAYWYWSPYLALNDMRSAVHDADADSFNAHVDYPKLRESLKGQLSALMTQDLLAHSNSGSGIDSAGAALGGMLGLAFVDRIVDAVVRPEAVMHAMQNGKFKFGREAKNADEANLAAANVDISTLQLSLKLYKLDHGSYPSQEQGLEILLDPSSRPEAGSGYLDKLPLDPWGRPYQYRNPGAQPGEVDVTYLPPPASSAPTAEPDDNLAWHTERKGVDMLVVHVGQGTEKSTQGETRFVMARDGFARWKLTEIRLPAAGSK
jgi:type II secretion system protein G